MAKSTASDSAAGDPTPVDPAQRLDEIQKKVDGLLAAQAEPHPAPPMPDAELILSMFEAVCRGFEHLASQGMANTPLAVLAAGIRASMAQVRARAGG